MIQRHEFHATYTKGEGIKIIDALGNEVRATFAGTTDNRTVYAHVAGIGIIGGWSWPHQPMKWECLADSINQGKLYWHVDDLPHSHGPGSRGPRRRM